MSNPAGYRFLPWTRQGLVAAITEPVSGASLPARANVVVALNIKSSGGGTEDKIQEYRAPNDAIGLYGPGDIIGIDQRSIVRTSPRPGCNNVETNYFAAIEFDPPDFPWMFTPARADEQQRLLPWLVLLVLDRARVELPKTDRHRPLPTIKIAAEFAGQELPDLSESWAWAHTQVMMEQDNTAALTEELRNQPNHNVSRLLCPRRLEANHHYLACLVPAFDVGVLRGLGGTPDPKLNQNLAPAWPTPPGAVELPVYYHWEFATGPLGDFESLARKLKPFACPESVGLTPMYIGDGNPVIPVIDPSDDAGNTLMDGALRAPQPSSRVIPKISDTIQNGLQTALNAPARFLEDGPKDATPVLGPPIYGQWHMQNHEINANTPAWMTELNLDPRARVAAGLGAEVVRKYQEDFMHEAWEQVGEIRNAQDRLNWGRLSFEANLRSYVKHFSTMPSDRLLGVAAPLLGRTRIGTDTLMVRLRGSSLTNAAADPALRRLTSSQRPMIKATVRRLSQAGRLSNQFAAKGRSSLIESLASGQRSSDPTRFTPDGLIGSVTLDSTKGMAADSVLDLTTQGLEVKIDASRSQAYLNAVQPMTGRNFQSTPLTLEPRADLRTVGVVTRSQIDNLTELNLSSTDPIAATSSLATTVQTILETSAKNPGAKGMLVTLNKDSAASIDPLEIDSKGAVFIHSVSGGLTQVGSVSAEIVAGGILNINAVLADLPVGTFSRVGTVKPAVSQGAGGDVLLRNTAFNTKTVPATGIRGAASVLTVRPIAPAATLKVSPQIVDKVSVSPDKLSPVITIPPVTLPQPTTPPMLSNTVPMPITSVEAVTMYEQTIRAIITDQSLNLPAKRGQFVAFNINESANTLLARLDPKIIIPKRMQQMFTVNGNLLSSMVDRRLQVTPWFDRIMAAPDLPAPSYQFLANYDKNRFVPGIGVIPPNSITLLETNPRFIEAFMVGINYEMNRELLWREYPTDQRGTPFRHFWQWLDGQPDIPLIHTWARNGTLGSHTRSAGSGGQIVLLIRGELIRRYPNAVLLAWKATPDGKGLTEQPAIIKAPMFAGKLDPDIIFAGFDLLDEDINREGGWFFLVQEQPTEPRFGFDQPDDSLVPLNLSKWPDANWSHTGVVEGGYLNLGGNPLNNRKLNGLTFGRNSAHIASICLQQPMRVAVHGRYLVTKEGL